MTVMVIYNWMIFSIFIFGLTFLLLPSSDMLMSMSVKGYIAYVSPDIDLINDKDKCFVFSGTFQNGQYSFFRH